jgi:hypothetical protein
MATHSKQQHIGEEKLWSSYYSTKEPDVNAQGGRYSNTLQAAAYRGREAVVKLLLNKGA